MRLITAVDGPATPDNTLAELPAVLAAAHTTISVASAHAASAWAPRTAGASLAVIAAATVPPRKAAKTPVTAHHTNAAHVTVRGLVFAVGTSTLSIPMPSPSMIRRTCTTRDVRTPAPTADQVQRVGIVL